MQYIPTKLDSWIENHEDSITIQSTADGHLVKIIYVTFLLLNGHALGI